MTRIVITIDGTAGVGKGTLAQKLATYLNYDYLDSGAIYRVLGYKIAEEQWDPNSEQSINYAKQMPLTFVYQDQQLIVILDGEDITKQVRSIEGATRASNIAKIPQLRAALKQFQRNFAQDNNLVADGRDMGTNIFPNAQHKFYLTASTQTRALRRAIQLQQTDQNSIALIEQSLIERDKNDQQQISPAEDAIVIDTSDLNAEQVFSLVLKHIKS